MSTFRLLFSLATDLFFILKKPRPSTAEVEQEDTSKKRGGRRRHAYFFSSAQKVPRCNAKQVATCFRKRMVLSSWQQVVFPFQVYCLFLQERRKILAWK